jgi:Flp pilus assembly protein TadD
LTRQWICAGAAVLLAQCAAPARTPQVQAPLGADAHLKMADAAAAAGNPDLAATMYTRALSDPKLDPAGRIRAAEMLVQLGRIGTAEAALNDRLRTAPDEIELRRALVRLHIVAGKAQEAIGDCDALLAHDPRDMAAVVDKAVALDLLGRHTDAQTLYRRALAAKPDDEGVRSDLALSQALQGNIAEATATMAPLRARADLPERVKADLGLLYTAGDDPASARAWLDGRAPDDADVALLAGAIRARAAGPGQ